MSGSSWNMNIGATVLKEGGTRFRVWAPKAETVSLMILTGNSIGDYVMDKEEKGYFSLTLPHVGDGEQYMYRLNDRPPLPDPVSRFQPLGVSAPSQVVDPSLFSWQDQGWNGIPLDQYRIYELHVGTFTQEGTFEAATQFLDYLLDLGITAVEIMPVSQCPGKRNWGYDGVQHFAPQNNYGGPGGMKRFIDACHRKGLAVILDVVYNHFGPEGNHNGDFGYYFTDKYRTPWGGAINFDGQYSDSVLEYFMSNAMYWIHEFHLDALRLDAVDWIFDMTPVSFLRHLGDHVRALREEQGKQVYLFAENDTNDVRLINHPSVCGLGIDSQWCDNFHHAIRTFITSENTGYYEDFGSFNQIVKAFTDAYVFTGEYSEFRKRRYGGPVGRRPTSQFVVFSQNHDQIGNRKCGDRLSERQPLHNLLLLGGMVILSPYIPLIFMGEEYGERAPFHYFIDHSDPELIEAVRKGKHEEHASGFCEDEIPDPSLESVFLECKLDLTRKREGEQALILEFYRKLFALRARLPALQVTDRKHIEVIGMRPQKVLAVRRHTGNSSVLCLFALSNMEEEISLTLPKGNWEKVLDSSEDYWRGPGAQAPGNIVASGSENKICVNAFSVMVYASSDTGG